MSIRLTFKALQYIILAGWTCQLSAQTYDITNGYSAPRPQLYTTLGDLEDQKQHKQKPNAKISRKEAVAQLDERDQDIQHRAYRMGDWDYKSNWRYDRKAFYRGESQPQAVREEYLDGPGIGYDERTNFSSNRNSYYNQPLQQYQYNDQVGGRYSNSNYPTYEYQSYSNQPYSQSVSSYSSDNRGKNSPNVQMIEDAQRQRPDRYNR